LYFLEPAMKIPFALFAATAALVLSAGEPLKLPKPEVLPVTLAEALNGRRTERKVGPPALSLPEASLLAWAAQGENRPGRRTAPAIYAKYSLDLYLITSGSDSLPAGVYQYQSAGHQLLKVAEGGPKQVLGKVKGMFSFVTDAPGVFVVAGDIGRVESVSFGKGQVYTFFEAGAASQNLLLQAAAMKLGVAISTPYSVDMDAVAQAMNMPKGARPLTLMPIGHPVPGGN
jgi:SagB-type dehydrogenase family enzyme